MRSKSPEMRGRQKVVRPPTYRNVNEYNPEATPQYFQVIVNVLEGKNLSWVNPQNGNSYVVVVLGKKKYSTSVRRHIMLEPYYKERFVFDIYTTICDIRNSILWMAVMEPKCCAPPRTIGEVSIDLGSIWSQPDHQIYHKWAQLCLPGNSSAGPVGFIKMDISITCRDEILATPTLDDHKSEGNLLLPVSSEQQCADYIITVYGAYGLPNDFFQSDKRLGKSPSTFVKVTFCQMTAKTGLKRRTNNPAFCEQISMIEMFPNLCQVVNFEVYSVEGSFNRILSIANLNLCEISHHGENGFLPTFGPSLLHLYGTPQTGSSAAKCKDHPYYCGALLVMLKTVVPYYEGSIGTVIVEPVPPVHLENLWLVEDFCIFCPILDVSMLDQSITDKTCGVAITIGEFCDKNTNNEFLEAMNESRSRKLHYTGGLEVTAIDNCEYGFIDFKNAFPVLQFAIRLPDLRFKMYRNNRIQRIVTNLESIVCEVEKRLKTFDYNNIEEVMNKLNVALDETLRNISKFIDIVNMKHQEHVRNDERVTSQFSTELDFKQLTMQKEEMGKLSKKISGIILSKENVFVITRKSVKLLLNDMQCLIQDLKVLIYKNIESWPNITVWLLKEGSRIAYGQLCTSDVVYSAIPEQCSKDCGRVLTIDMKPLKCSKHHALSFCTCIAGKVDFILWMGLYRQHSEFLQKFTEFLPGYKLKANDNNLHAKCTAMVVEYRAFIYKAKFRNIVKGLSLLQSFLRIYAMNTSKETKVKCKTFTPIWNEVLKIRKMMYMTPGRLAISPPIVFVEVYNTIVSENELIGRCQIKPVISESLDYECAPTLQWFDLFKGAECTGQVLMSVQVIQVVEKILKNTIYGPITECYAADCSKELEFSDDFECLPSNLLPSSSYKIDIYWWGLRDVNISQKPGVILEIEDLKIKSNIIYDKKINSNFPNGKISEIFEAHLNGSCCPQLSLRLFDSSTFGRTLDLGINVMKNPNKYLINWWPKNQREMSLKLSTIQSSDFIQVNPSCFIKKSSELLSNGGHGSRVSIKSTISNVNTKHMKWYNLFWQRELDEEEYTLLPIFSKNESKSITNNENIERKDWWQKYIRSHEEYYRDTQNASEKLIIYDTELESQPEFSKFKDWCKAFKLYNGKKTRILEKDEQIYCGLLKADIAIYRWPPPENVIPVSSTGVDLNKGYFDDHPNNEPIKFLVRVYLVRGIKLKTKGFTGKCNPYVILTCGNKCLGDRDNYNIQDTFNPIFGKMYEFQCSLPMDYLLDITVRDHESSDEIIGSTCIDLEDRIYTKHRARVGLSNEYSKNELLKWRDCVKPSEILEEVCARNYLPSPVYSNNSTIVVNGVVYKNNDRDKNLSSDRKENLCLSFLRNWHTMPICGYHFVPDHVETRTLYNFEKSNLEQGKLQLWVDIYPLDTEAYIPPPIDITPSKVEDYVLLVTIHCVRDLIKDSSGRRSDVYIRAWFGSNEQTQNTDVYYDCPKDMYFNWRMAFNFQYHPSVQKIILQEKGIFKEHEEYISPVLVIQLMSYEGTHPNDCLGTLKLHLNAMPQGSNLIKQCKLQVMSSIDFNLFSSRTLSSWWPLTVQKSDKLITGKIYMDLNLLSQKQTALMPVGKGRESRLPIPKPLNTKNSIEGFCNNMSPIENVRGFFKAKNCILLICVIIVIVVILSIYFKLPMPIHHIYYMLVH